MRPWSTLDKRGRPLPAAYPCGDPRTRDNSWSFGKIGWRCKQCARAAQKEYRAAKSRERIRFKQNRQQKPEPVVDSDIQRYRQEKTRRAAAA